MTQSSYNADAIEVLSGLEPVRRRPGMYTDTTRPNHLGQEVIDNSVDEALAGHAKRIDVILHADQSLEVIDDGRGMPVDIHPEEGVPAVELILCRLHAGGKFSNKTTSSPAACTALGSGGQRPVEAGGSQRAPRRQRLRHRLRKRRQGAGSDGDRHLRQTQYRHQRALLAGRTVLRQPALRYRA